VPGANGWFVLFNGKDLCGWMTFNSGAWRVGGSGSVLTATLETVVPKG